MATLTLRNICKAYGAVEVIKGIDLDVDDREFVVFVGPSGCGKSTLLRMVAGLERITSGDLLIDGQRANDVDASRRGLAMVFQSYALYPHMTVAENMAFSLKINGASAADRAAKVQEAARILQLGPLLERRPKELSGGQRQRVAIGRAIVRSPKAFLFDEPLSNLDAALRVNMRLELMRLHESLRATMIYVTHDQTEAMTMADKIVVLNAGRVEQIGSPLALYNRPANLFVAGFIGSPRMNFLDATVEACDATGVDVRFAGGQSVRVPAVGNALAPGERVTLGIRPEALRLADGPLRGEVRIVEQLGSLTILHVEIAPGVVLVVQAEGGSPVAIHAAVGLAFDPAACHLFNADGKALRPAACQTEPSRAH
ncbi:MAG: sn-glycerol-3-phosphate ABC transporter ATP-binding protein UgpC [Amaricoccus sp.]|uniref:ABC transporter ATP-binding protein n=1 Tax=Amaricoccus sp. TaxID=1872485 RepID=UPI0039E3FC2F